MHDSSDLSDAPGSDGETEGSSALGGRPSSRRTQATERQLARAKQASQKQALAESRRLDEEVNKCERRLEQIERDFRKLLGAVRVKPLGRDRFYNRVWWFDGMGSASLLGTGGSVQYGTGRIFLQGPSEFDVEILQRRGEEVTARRREEEGPEGMLGVGEWAVYEEIETVRRVCFFRCKCALILSSSDRRIRRLAEPEGCSRARAQERPRKVVAAHWPWDPPAHCCKRRPLPCISVPPADRTISVQDLQSRAIAPEARRSARTKQSGSDLLREPYMQWTNRRAVNAS